MTELLANSVRYGDGEALVRTWLEREALVCEVHDGGRIEDPLIDRHQPEDGDLSRRGLWLVNQLCDLVQLRSSDHGTVVRVHIRRR